MKESDIMGVLQENDGQEEGRLSIFHHRSGNSRSSKMSAKDVRFSGDARDRMLLEIDILANAVRVTLAPTGATSC
jgi:hypothetical protein